MVKPTDRLSKPPTANRFFPDPKNGRTTTPTTRQAVVNNSGANRQNSIPTSSISKPTSTSVIKKPAIAVTSCVSKQGNPTKTAEEDQKSNSGNRSSGSFNTTLTPEQQTSPNFDELRDTRFWQHLNRPVLVDGQQRGVLRYFGPLHVVIDGLFCGIELDEPVGQHDGKIDGRRYFHTTYNKGVFASMEKVELIGYESIETPAISTKPKMNTTVELIIPPDAEFLTDVEPHLACSFLGNQSTMTTIDEETTFQLSESLMFLEESRFPGMDVSMTPKRLAAHFHKEDLERKASASTNEEISARLLDLDEKIEQLKLTKQRLVNSAKEFETLSVVIRFYVQKVIPGYHASFKKMKDDFDIEKQRTKELSKANEKLQENLDISEARSKTLDELCREYEQKMKNMENDSKTDETLYLSIYETPTRRMSTDGSESVRGGILDGDVVKILQFDVNGECSSAGKSNDVGTTNGQASGHSSIDSRRLLQTTLIPVTTKRSKSPNPQDPTPSTTSDIEKEIKTDTISSGPGSMDSDTNSCHSDSKDLIDFF